MIEGKIEIYLSYKEPEFKDNILWLRPCLDKEGYELLYYGAKGWTPLICCIGQCNDFIVPPYPHVDKEDSYPDADCMVEIPKEDKEEKHLPCNCG